MLRSSTLATAIVVALGAFGAGPVAAQTTCDGYGYGYGYGYGSGCDPNATDPAPVSGAYDPAQPGPTVVGSPSTAATVVAPPGVFDFPASVTLDQNPPDTGPAAPQASGLQISVLSAYFDVDVTNTSSGQPEHGGDWDPPLEVNIAVQQPTSAVSDASLAPYYNASGSWVAIPSIQGRTTLNSGEQDGWYLTGSDTSRVVHILSRHATTFAAFSETATGGGATGGTSGSGSTSPGATTPGTGPKPAPGSPAPAPAVKPRPSVTPVVPLGVVASVPSVVHVRHGSFRLRCKVVGPAVRRCLVSVLGLGRHGRRLHHPPVIARGAARLTRGKATVVVRLTSYGRHRLGKHGSLRALIKLRGQDSHGRLAKVTDVVTLTAKP